MVSNSEGRYLSSQCFHNKVWRGLLEEVIGQIDVDNLGLEVISPFGFEITSNKAFLYKNLRKFYCYIGVPLNYQDKINSYDLSEQFLDLLMKKMQQYDAVFFSDIAMVVSNGKFKKLRDDDYICHPRDKLIDVVVRYTSSGIKEDYAKYIICTITSIIDAKGEASNYRYSKRTKSRLLQLYIMLEGVFKSLLPPLDEKEIQLLHKVTGLIDNNIQIFFNESQDFYEYSCWDKEIIDELVLKRVEQIRSALQADTENENLVLECDAYHIPDKLSLSLDTRHYEMALDKLICTYENFV